ncbi:MAG: cytochrome c-type biogenesis protein [Gemmatimonadaceae bacterium]
MTRRSLMTAAAVAALVGFAAGGRSQEAPGAAAQEAADAELEARTTAVASTLRCPVCQGESIQDSPSELAQDMRALVREQLRAGKTPEEVKAYFVGRYGEWILLEPRMTGLNILLYVFPVILVLGGLAFVVVLVRKWSASQPKPE